MISVRISNEPIDGWRFDAAPNPMVGAEITFSGRVREHEKREKISALEYEHYEGMARKEMEKIAMQALDKFGIFELHCVHRVGTIPVGEATIMVLVRSKHRQEGFDAIRWFMDSVKQKVPIWKTGSVKDSQ